MSIKSIKSNYIKFLESLKEADVTINESQKEIFDNFVSSIENTIYQTRDDAIRTTVRLVEDKMEKEYKEVIENIIKHQQEHSEITDKLQSKVCELKDSADIVDAVDKFLDKHVEEVLPKKTIVDYEKMEKLEKIHESLKEMLINSESEQKNDDVVAEVEEKEEKEETSVEDTKEVEKTEEDTVENDKTEEKDEIVTKKDEKEITKEEIDQDLTDVLKEVEHEISDDSASKEETNLEEAIESILEEKAQKASDKENNSSKVVDGQEFNSDETDCCIDEEFDTDDKFESVQINESIMQMWIDTINRTTPIK